MISNIGDDALWCFNSVDAHGDDDDHGDANGEILALSPHLCFPNPFQIIEMADD